MLLLIAGNSLVGVATPLRARIEDFPDLTVGLLGSVYFAGMPTGTLAAPATIRRGGHIRAYAAFVGLAVVSVIVMPDSASQLRRSSFGGSSLSLAHCEGGGRTEAGGTPIP